MNQTQLNAFRAVAESGGFSRGAERLMVSQPAVSLQIAELELHLAAKLFDRLPRGVRLTEAGQILLTYARRIEGLSREAQQAIGELRGLRGGRLVIGASLTVGSYVMPPILGEFRHQYPEIELILDVANTEQIQRKLLDNELDIGFTEGLAEHADLISESFYADELVAVCPPGHPILKLKRVTAAQFCSQPIILREQGSGTRAVVEQALAAKGISVHPVMSLGSIEAVKRAVMAGVGLAIVSELAIETERQAGALLVVTLSDLQLRRPLHQVELKGKTRGFASRAFLEMLTKQFPGAGKEHARPAGAIRHR